MHGMCQKEKMFYINILFVVWKIIVKNIGCENVCPAGKNCLTDMPDKNT